MPHLLEVLRIVPAGARRFTDLQRSEDAAIRQCQSKFRNVLTAICAQIAPRGSIEGETGVPFHRASQPRGQCFDGGTAIAGIEYQRLDVARYAQRAMHVGFDVVIEPVAPIPGGDLDQAAACGNAEPGRFEYAIGKTEGGALHNGRGQPQVRRTETRGAAHPGPPVIEGAILRPLVRRRAIVGPAEDTAFPQPACATCMRGKTAVTRAGLELRAIARIVRQPVQDGLAPVKAVRMEIDGHTQLRVQRGAVAPIGKNRQRVPLRWTQAGGSVGRVAHPRMVHRDRSPASTNQVRQAPAMPPWR